MKNKTKYKSIMNLAVNNAIYDRYYRTLKVMINNMNDEMLDAIERFYNRYSDYLVFDADNVVDKLDNLVNRISAKWQKLFDKRSELIARINIKETEREQKARFRKIKKSNPFLLKSLKERERLTDIVEANIAENVSLIKSIPQQYHDKVLYSTMEATKTGGDANNLYNKIKEIGHSTDKRAKFIAQDQIMKATTDINRQIAIETGLTKARWNKSVAGKTHRRSHADSDGKIFSIEKGCLIDGEYILPRQKINCKCSYTLIIKNI